MNGILLALLSSLFFCLVLLPLSFFYWLGASEAILSLKSGFRLYAAGLVAIFYGFNLFCVYLCATRERKWPYALMAYSSWFLGLLGFYFWLDRSLD